MIKNNYKRGLTPEDRASGFFNNENTRTDVINFNLICGYLFLKSNPSTPQVSLRREREGWKGAYCKKRSRVEVRKRLGQPESTRPEAYNPEASNLLLPV